MIRAIIAKESFIKKISENWVYAEKHNLPQGYALIFLNDKLFDDIEELFDKEDAHQYPQFQFLTDSVISFLTQESKGTQMLYVETDYFDSYCTQSGTIFENGQMILEPIQGKGVINHLLHKIGVYKETNKDECSSMQLFRFRFMDWDKL